MSTAVASSCTPISCASPRVDWFAVITELEGAGVTLRQQAARCAVSVGTMCYWKLGGEPKHVNGSALIGLFSQTFPAKSVPMQMFKNLNGT